MEPSLRGGAKVGGDDGSFGLCNQCGEFSPRHVAWEVGGGFSGVGESGGWGWGWGRGQSPGVGRGDHLWERGGVEADFAEEFLFEKGSEGRGGVGVLLELLCKGRRGGDVGFILRFIVWGEV